MENIFVSFLIGVGRGGFDTYTRRHLSRLKGQSSRKKTLTEKINEWCRTHGTLVQYGEEGQR